jgi:hypothetical protein
MVLTAAILLIVVVIVATILTVGSDVVRRPDGEKLVAFKDWQALIGAVLGFMGAAGVLVLGTAIEGDQERQRAVARQHAIGYGLALEAERISNGLTSVIGIANLIRANPEQDYELTCNNFISTMSDVLARDTPVYLAALDEMIEFGDQNLALFVRFFGLHSEIVQDLGRFDRKWCELDPQGQVAEYERRVGLDLEFYRIIANRYGTAIIEPAPAESAAPAEESSPAPSAEPPATASAVN